MGNFSTRFYNLDTADLVSMTMVSAKKWGKIVKPRAGKVGPSTIFQFSIPNAELNRILFREADFPWHEMPNDGGWDYGANLDYMKELCAYWVNEFDWRTQCL